MTLEEEYQLSCYEELTVLDNEKQVYLVKEKQTGELFVKKKIRCSQPEIYQILMEEKFQGIPQVHHIIQDGDQVILIEEYVHGSSLEKLLQKNGKIEQEKVLQIWLCLCTILKQLHHHDQPIIHRDLKPSNIMLSKEGNVYLIDFNASRQYRKDHKKDTEFIGTVDYAPPEQYGFRQTDSRSDIFALGVTINYLLIGKHPNDKIPDGKLGQMISKCIHLDPEQRYQTIEELEKDLHKLLGDSIAEINFLPPGFRTKTRWKMIIAVIGYAMLMYLSFTLEADDPTGKPLIGKQLWFERIFVFSGFLCSIFYYFNYMGISDKMLDRFREREFLYHGIKILVSVAILMIAIMVMVIIEDIFW